MCEYLNNDGLWSEVLMAKRIMLIKMVVKMFKGAKEFIFWSFVGAESPFTAVEVRWAMPQGHSLV